MALISVRQGGCGDLPATLEGLLSKWPWCYANSHLYIHITNWSRTRYEMCMHYTSLCECDDTKQLTFQLAS